MVSAQDIVRAPHRDSLALNRATSSLNFSCRVKRKVHPKTATVEIDGVAFQCESFLRGRWVRVFYDPFRLDDVLVFLGDKRVQRAFPQ